MNYVPLYIKTDNSLLSSLITIDELILFAKKNDIKTLTITDNNMYGVIEFYNKCINNNIKPVVGIELDYDSNNILLYCKNYNGYKNLLKLTTIASERKITYEDLKEYKSNLIFISFNVDLYDKLSDLYESSYIGYNRLEERKNINRNNLVYCNSILYFDEKDYIYLNYLSAIKDNKLLDSIKINNSFILDYSFVPEIDLKNNEEINNLCNLEIEKSNNLLPIYDCPDGLDSFSYLKKLCIDGLKRIFGSTVSKEYQERLKYELDVINKMGFSNYFLIVWDYVKYAKDNNILVGPGRGSAAGSLVSYCLNITTIDPIRYNLLFERFLNIMRISMPDIDIDFEYNRREEVINYCINKYGIKKVAPIITFGTLGAKQAIRDVGRTLDIDLKVIDYICKLIDSRLTLKENYNINSKLKDYLSLDKELINLYKVATKLEGLKRHTSIHAAGIVMSNIDLDQVIPLDKSHDEFYTTGYSMEYLESLGLLKMDFLALRNLTLINDTINSVNRSYNLSLTFDNIKENDSKAFEIFKSVNTIGIFQFESKGMINFLKKLRPSNFEEIFSSLALFRPGPMNNIDSYIKRKKGKEKIDYFHPNLVNILSNTYGIIIYQEQIMEIARTMANYTYGEADILRRAMSKKKEDVLINEKDKFINRSVKNGYDVDIATKVYELILKFASYGFNRAHSVAYAMISYKMAYLKAYYPKHFLSKLLTSVIGSEIKTKEYIYECRLNKVDILLPDINLSTNTYEIEDSGIRYPFNNIKNVGESISRVILKEREFGKFIDIYDFVKRCFKKSINKKTLESLIYAGCFDSFNINRRTLIDNLDLIINYGEIGELLEDTMKPILELKHEFDKHELMNKEKEVFGFYLSNNPITDYKAKYSNIINLEDVKDYFDKQVNLIIMVDRIKEIITKKQEKMCFMVGSDEIATCDFTLFPKVYLENNNIKIGDILLVNGKVEKRYDSYQIIVNKVNVLQS